MNVTVNDNTEVTKKEIEKTPLVAKAKEDGPMLKAMMDAYQAAGMTHNEAFMLVRDFYSLYNSALVGEINER